jgi:exodeoxyribonuclease-3
MKIVSWNVNSIRARHDHVRDWLAGHAPDLLCLQETKVRDEEFPLQTFGDMGYTCHIYGQPAYNGVAFFAKGEVQQLVYGLPGQHDDGQQKRFIAGTYNGVHVVNVYAPNGQSPAAPAFAYKRAWYQALTAYLQQAVKAHAHVLLCGDLNIAPAEDDVHDPAKLLGTCGYHPDEHVWLNSVMDTGLVDVVRQRHGAGKLFSWWDYRQGALERDRGMRIDHILTTPTLANRCAEAYVDKEPRLLEKPSDHAPVVAVFKG